MRIKRIAYRDSKTGRFVSKKTWTRSHAAGGTRYKRNRVSVIPARTHKPPRRVAARPKKQPKLSAFLISFKYRPSKRGAPLVVVDDLICPARTDSTDDEVLETAARLIQRDFPDKISWIALLFSEDVRKKLQFKVSVIPGMKAPKTVIFRSAIRRVRP